MSDFIKLRLNILGSEEDIDSICGDDSYVRAFKFLPLVGAD